MKSKLTQVATYEVKSLVSAYLLALTFAKVQRQRVDEIHRALLDECPIYADRNENEKITKSGDLYLSSDESACEEFYAAANHALRKAGIKPDDMPDEKCPALVAEHDRIKIEWKLIDAAGKPFGISNDNILNDGMATRQKFLDLVVGLVVSLPDFKNPITGKAA
jgi:hypothetical protein